jgi:hypothetical protein
MSQQRDASAFDGKFRLIASLLMGLFIGSVAGGGIIFHDGKSVAEGALAGLGFFAFGFGLMYFRYARRIAEILGIR